MTAGALHGGRCVVAGGAGAVGRMVAELLLGAGATVSVVDDAAAADRAPAGCRFVGGDVTSIDAALAAELARSDFAVLAVPEDVALASVEGVCARLARGALIADTLSVKGRVVAALQAHATGLEAVSLNPLFAPSLGLAGRAVAAVVVHDGARVRELLALIGDRGGRVVEVGADEHDALAAATQALTHAAVLAFGLALADLDLEVAELAALAPPPHATLLALLARISSGAPETYWDVQAANPYARRARAALAAGARRLDDVVDGGDIDDFDALLGELRDLLGGDRDHYLEAATRLLATTHEPPCEALTRTNDQR